MAVLEKFNENHKLSTQKTAFIKSLLEVTLTVNYFRLGTNFYLQLAGTADLDRVPCRSKFCQYIYGIFRAIVCAE